MNTIGFLGTGEITRALVLGLKSSALRDLAILLSPRSEAVSATLAGAHDGVTVAPDNQAVIDGADVIVLAVRPQVAGQVLAPLTFPPGTPVISLIAATPAKLIADWTGVDPAMICRAIPLPSAATRRCATPVFPPLPDAMRIFDALGTALAVDDADTFDTYAAASALMASYFAFVESAADWATASGLPPADAHTYIRTLIANLGDTMRDSAEDLATLREAHQTPGGLNEHAALEFARAGGPQALGTALDAALARVTGHAGF